MFDREEDIRDQERMNYTPVTIESLHDTRKQLQHLHEAFAMAAKDIIDRADLSCSDKESMKAEYDFDRVHGDLFSEVVYYLDEAIFFEESDLPSEAEYEEVRQ